MRIALLNIINVDLRNSSKMACMPPSGVDYISSYIKKHLDDCEILISYDYQELLKFKPDIFGISALSHSYNLAIAVARQVKKHSNIPVIMGGVHISVFPDTLDKNMDIGVIGEGEITFLELLKLYLNKNVNEETLSKINGLIFRDSSGNIVKTPSRELIKDIDSIPIPSRTFMDDDLKNYEHQLLFTSRGCSFNCKYCASTSFWQRKIRFFSAERVVSEISYILSKKYKDNLTIFIMDDLFSTNKQRLREMADLIKAEKINEKLKFGCYARAETFDQEMCDVFKEMGIISVGFGFESINDRVVSYMKGGKASSKENQRALELCQKNDLICSPHFMVGFPTETKEEAAQSYWFIRKNMYWDKIDFKMFPTTPLPGTYLWDYGVEKGIIPKNFNNWDSLSFEYKKGHSIYLNVEGYSEEDYSQILPEFYAIKNHPKFSKTIKNFKEKNLYITQVGTAINQLLDTLNSENILEISSFGKSLKEVFKFENKKITYKHQKSPNLNIDDLDGQLFDSILLLHSLENLKNPKEELDKLLKYLKPDGYIFVLWYNIRNPIYFIELLSTMPLYKWGIFERENISYFSKKTIDDFSKELNLKMILDKNFPINIEKEDLRAFMEFLKIMKKYITIPLETSKEYFLSSLSVLKRNNL